jgi:signal transduction histidine kinase
MTANQKPYHNRVLLSKRWSKFLTNLLQLSTRLSLQQNLRLGEWFLIAVDLVLNVLNGGYRVPFNIVLQALSFYAVFGLLSCFIPVNGPLWQRRGYVALNMLLVIGTSVTPVPINLLLSWAIVKTCFLLELREVITVIILTGIAYALGSIWGLPNMYAMINDRTINDLLTPQALILSNVTFFLSGSIFSLLLSVMILVERRSRQQAETLAKEVEILSAHLERTRIARDIHDSLGHSLTTLGVQLEVAQKLRSRQPDQSFQALDTAKTLLDQCLEEVRQAIHTIQQSNFNFDQALSILVNQVKQNQSLHIDTDIKLPLLPVSIQYQIYCILCEGLTNVQRHANASHVMLQTQTTPDTIQIILADNGKGFDPTQITLGFGLQSMQERVQSLTGKLTIQSVIGHGTTLHITIHRRFEFC